MGNPSGMVNVFVVFKMGMCMCSETYSSLKLFFCVFFFIFGWRNLHCCFF